MRDCIQIKLSLLSYHVLRCDALMDTMLVPNATLSGVLAHVYEITVTCSFIICCSCII